ncbi:MAG: SDR family NAD(P)-dependent oxidoreductase [Gammaproteobacteria bacterium]
MLEILNRYIHGYIAIPVILTCNQKGIFNFLSRDKAFYLDQLSSHFKANDGHLQIALRMFESMKWVQKNSDGLYLLTLSDEDYKIIKSIPEKIISLYSIPFEQLLKKYRSKKTLQKWLSFVINFPSNEDSLLRDYLDGVVIVPLLLALKNAVAQTEQLFSLNLPRGLMQQIKTLFLNKQWAGNVNNEMKLTDAGKFMLERAYNVATAASYAPMLAKMNTLLFNDAKNVFKKDLSGHELHLDRTLNVIGSGFQHIRYFKEVEEIIISIFNQKPFDKQPNYIIDTGCGDGTFLKNIYDVICTKSARGSVILQYPLHVIGVDFNKKSLIATENTLKAIPHYTLEGDIGNPEKIMSDLRALGLKDPENSLHIRSFLDHDRPYLKPIDVTNTQKRSSYNYQGVYVDAHGKVIQSNEVVQSLVEHLARWASVISKHGLLLLEVHCLSPETVSASIDQNESFHFDAYHAFSKQYLVEADVFLMSAAEVGLFPKMEFSRRYPNTLPYTRISLNFFEKKPYSLRFATQADMPFLLALEAECTAKELCTSSYEVKRRITQFPQGQFVVTIAGKIVGAAYTQKISDLNQLSNTDYQNISVLQNQNGNIVQLLGINVAPELQDSGLGDQLLEFILWHVTVMGGIEKVVGITRCKNYATHTHLSMEQYVQNHIETEGGIDPILRFHTSHGAEIKAVLPCYRSEDHDNQGAGVLIEYQIPNRAKSLATEQVIQVRKSEDNTIHDTICHCVKLLLTDKFKNEFSINYQLRDMGFDSLGLLELRTLINQQFSMKLDPTFFFEYATPLAIINYLKQRDVQERPQTIADNVQVLADIKQEKDNQAIAVIGIGCRFPGDVKDSTDFWNLIKTGKNAITPVPENRRDLLGDSMAYGGFLSNVDGFDATFFHISPREAELMDPQQRILLEVTWEALENAGIPASQLSGTNAGVFVGIFSHDYETLLTKNLNFKKMDAYFATGNSGSVAAGRLAYSLGLQGPAFAINTACSSSLVAVHLACQSLRLDECNLALASGVNLILSPELNMAFSNAGMLAPDGKCKTFDAAADGYVRSEGCGVLVLKKLSQAIADGDTILSVILGSAINQDGASNGLTAPNKVSQEKLLESALNSANITADTISYIEAHGTGTSLGDPVEVKAISNVFGTGNRANQSLTLGSVKTNLGHTEAAAGMAGMIKTILMLQHKQIPANLHFKNLNLHIDSDAQFLAIPTKLTPWFRHKSTPLRAGVSSFGFSGTNAHVILEEPSTILKKHNQRMKPAYLLTLSAKTDNSLIRKVKELHLWLTEKIQQEKDNNHLLAAISYTLNTKRCHFPKRYSIVAGSLNELTDTLQEISENNIPQNALFHSNDETDFLEQTFELKKLMREISDDNQVSIKMYREKLLMLGKFYVDSHAIDWAELYRYEAPHSISLPTYPFDNKRYWYDSYQNTTEKESSVEKHEQLVPYHGNEVTLEIINDTIALIRMIDKTNRNMLTKSMFHGLQEKFLTVKNNPKLKAVVITGYENIFCMGGDESALVSIAENKIKFTDLPFIYKGLLECELPVIAAMQGHAHGGGFVFGLYADMIILAEESTYTANFMQYGFTPGVGATFILKEKLGNVATEMMFTAKLLTGAELKTRTGQVIFKPQDQVLNEAIAIAMSLAEKPVSALKVLKQAMAKKILDQLPAVLESELAMHTKTFTSAEVKEKIQAVFNQTTALKQEAKNIPIAKSNSSEQITLKSYSASSAVPEKLSISIGDIQTSVKKIVAKVTHLDAHDITVTTSFGDFGMDSIAAVEIIRDLNQTLKINLETANLYSYPTVEKISQFIISSMKQIHQLQEEVQGIKLPVVSVENTLAVNNRMELKKTSVPEETKILELNSKSDNIDIAIIGMSGRFPDANNVDEFWENLAKGVVSIREIPEDRWDVNEYYDSNPIAKNKTYCRVGAFLKDVDRFDTIFFNISPKEAEVMDPQQRLFLEETWKAIEDAGYSDKTISGLKCGVFVGASYGDYSELLHEAGLKNSAFAFTGLSTAILAARISYLLNLKGPSIAIDTACSSSLVAIHQACESILSGQSEIGIVGGVSLMLTPQTHIMTAKAGMLSAGQSCRAFDQKADGIVLGEGVGVLVLKPLQQALNDGHQIYGVIKSSGINQDGTTTGLTAPNPEAQSALQLAVYKKAGINPEHISYVEAHGTGTALGDPIEFSALTQSFRQYTNKIGYCALGSVKSNIGHTTMAAGVVGVIKVLLALKNKKIPPQAQFENLSEHIKLDTSPFYISTRLREWEVNSGILRTAAVSSFGFSGTNAHLVLTESPTVDVKMNESNRSAYLFALSAKTEESLKQKINDLDAWLSKHSDFPLADVSYNMNHCRSHFKNRCAIVASTMTEFHQTLEKIRLGNVPENVSLSREILREEQNQSHVMREISHCGGQSPELYRNNLMNVAHSYSLGHDIDWEQLYIDEPKRKISFPTYPFTKERCWYDSYQTSDARSMASPLLNLEESNQSKVTLQVSQDGIAVIKIIDRANKNQLADELLSELEKQFCEIANNPMIKVVIVTGYDDIFCLGGSEAGLVAISQGTIKYTDMPFIYRGLLECKVPVIAAMQGHAFGAGLAFGLFADMVIMSEDHLYTANFMKYGFTPGVGSTLILKEKLSESLANEMLWTAKEYKGSELKSRGATVIFKIGEKVFDEAMSIAKTIAKKSSQALRVFKKDKSESLLVKLNETIMREVKMHNEIFSNQDATNNIKNYFNKLESYQGKNISDKTDTDVLTKPLAMIVAKHDSIAFLIKLVSNMLHIPPTRIDIHSSFKELGIDSIGAVEIVREINNFYKISIESAMIYDFPTIKQFANHIELELEKSVTWVEQAPGSIQLKSLDMMDDLSKKKIEISNAVLSRLDCGIQRKEQMTSMDPVDKSRDEGAGGKLTLPCTRESNYQKKISQLTSLTDIAIIGYSGRFPNANDVESFWHNLSSGHSAITEIPVERWPLENFYDADTTKPNHSYSKWGGFLSQIDQFDPLFFGISPADAELMDPQQRIFLEECWKTFETAGYSAEALAGKKCGVFVGVKEGDYAQLLKKSNIETNAQQLIGMSSSILAARISYLLDLKGPSLAIDTACSSSLVAIHQACQSLLLGESELALAGGIYIGTTTDMHIMTSKAGMLSSVGQCKTFDNSADGFVIGEGAGVLLLKSLEKAIKDRDPIYAVIKASGMNQDGKTNGITAPSMKSQVDLELEVYQRFNINPEDISFIEAHGTGTKMGDPIELGALTRAFSTYTKLKNFCGIGSVKTNIGHALTAAGVSSVIKMILCLKHKKLVPSLNFLQENENINFKNSQFYVNTEYKHWESQSGKPRLTAISSFGFSGTNAHLVLQEAPSESTQPKSVAKPAYLITLSAKTKNSLQQKIRELANWLKSNSNKIILENISYTLNAGRTHFEIRHALVVSSNVELEKSLVDLQKSNHNFITADHVHSEKITNLEELLNCELTNEDNYKELLLSIKEYYLQGYQIDWERLHCDETKQRILLPTYPFDKQRYWVPENNGLTDFSMQEKSSEILSLDSVKHQVMQIVSGLLKIPVSQLDVNKHLSEYGLDSIGMTNVINAINYFYHLSLTPAILFEHPTFSSFADFMVGNHLEQLETTISTKPDSANSSADIAIIGMNGIFPGAADLKMFWNNLITGKNCISEIPKNRWDWQDYYGDPFSDTNKTKIKWGGFVDNIGLFDAGFFNISPREAELIDPQQRLFLEVAWKTIEDAGYAPDELSLLKTGVFVGVVNNDYAELLQQNSITDAYVATGTPRCLIANRVSYLLNLQGPSEAIDTACASSLVAIHHAVQAIRNGECHVAIAGGVNALLTPNAYLATSKAGMLSIDGQCKTFDSDANGYVRGEGAAAILLKPLQQAMADGDTIYGVIKGVAINHGGHVSSITVPNPLAQADVISSALNQSNIEPNSISYIEMHGTGTVLGDPIEINGLKKVFNQAQSSQATCGLGSVKTHIGHLESAAGIAGVIKVLLSMQYKKLPGNLHFTKLNPYIDFAESPFYLVNKTVEWKRLKDINGNEIPRRAGISSFGFGGVNAHVILEESSIVKRDIKHNKQSSFLITLSAKHEKSLKQKYVELLAWLVEQKEEINLAALSFTLSKGRSHFQSRCAFVVGSVSDLHAGLTALIGGDQSNCFINHTKTNEASNLVYQQLYQSALTDAKNNNAEALSIIADLYIKQYPIEWDLLYLDKNKCRISALPGYPFSKEYYWFQPPQVKKEIVIKSSKNDLDGFAIHYLKSIFSEKLKLPFEEIVPDATYEVYGVESLLGIEILNRLEVDFGTLSKTLLFEKNTISDLALYLLKKHHDKLTQLLSLKSSIHLDRAHKKATVATMDAKTLATSRELNQLEDIAIIGLSGTYPMANNLEQFWENLVLGRDCISEVPIERWNYKDYPVKIGEEEQYFKHGGFIADVDKFDPLFFNISPRDAGLMDPQERLFLQSAWSTIEDAGYTRQRIKQTVNNKVGVFAGVTYNFYPLFIAEEWHKGNRIPLDIQLFSIANRVSYFLNFNGPSYIIDSACSSSLAAIHLAYESIQRGDCLMAIAGGVNLSLHPCKYHMLGSYSFMSSTGRCTSFGANGTGYVPGEGVGSVLLKPLSLAKRDGDHIYGVLKSSSMNHGGKTSGYSVPNPNAQTNVIQDALNKANIDPRTISYVEAHGTGTSLGDPIEVRGLQDAYEEFTKDKQFCAIGSVKSNIGHLESAAGISQLTKVLLQMKHQKLVPSLHATELNPNIEFADTPFFVQQQLSEWESPHGVPRRAGISSFGAGGTNIHMIVEEYPQVNLSDLPVINNSFIFVLSAQNAERLNEYLRLIADYLLKEKIYYQTDSQINSWLYSVCYTLQIGRERMASRLAIMSSNYQDLFNKLSLYLENPEQSYPEVWNGDPGEITRTNLVDDWFNGGVVLWDGLYKDKIPSIISLPSYPFAKRRCWITTQALPEPTIVDTAPQLNDWLYTARWEEKISHNIVQSKKETAHWLVFSDYELGLHLQNELGKSSCTYCFIGERFEKVSDEIFIINPSCREDYQKLLAHVHNFHGTELQGVIYLSKFLPNISIFSQDELSEVSKSFEPCVNLLLLFQEVIRHQWQGKLQFTLVTQSSQAVTENEFIQLWQHPLWSMTRIFGSEQVGYQVLLIDLDEKNKLYDDAKIIAHEIRHYQSKENHIAYRDHRRFIIRLNQYLSKDKVQEGINWTAPEAVIITGGLGALGVEVAKWLVQQGTQNLLLIGATQLPDKLSWSTIQDEMLKEKIKQLVDLESKANVKYVAIDVTNKQQMRNAIELTEHEWNKTITGVFHLAGITTDNVPIEKMSDVLLQKVMSVKKQGALVLHELFQNADLQCFVLFSSISAMPYFGINGLSAYACANEFLNGLSLYRQQQGLPAMSINWAAWAEKGMSFNYNHTKFVEAVGMSLVSPSEGMKILKYLLVTQPKVIGVFKVRWQQFMTINREAKSWAYFDNFVTRQSEHVKANEILNKAQLTVLLIKILAELLELDVSEIAVDVPFQNYGMDSIIGIHFIGKLSSYVPDVVSPMDLYRYPTLEQLTDYINSTTQPENTVLEKSASSKLFDGDEQKFMDEMENLGNEQIAQLIEDELVSVNDL